MASPAAFRIVVAYEDFGTGLRAARVLARVAAEAGWFADEGEFWKLESLEDADLQRQLTEAVMRAQMVVISARSLPDRVRRWMEHWIPRKRGSGAALVALLDANETVPTESDCSVYLQRLAQQARMEYFGSTRDWETEEAVDTRQELLRRARSHSTVLDEILQRGGPSLEHGWHFHD